MPQGEKIKAANKADAMWANMSSWLKRGAIPDEQEIEDDLCGREFGYNHDSEIQLEKKRRLKKRGLSSPDNADGLALTFAHAVSIATVQGLYEYEPRHPLMVLEGGSYLST